MEVRFVGNSSNGASAWVASPAISIGKGVPTVLSDESYYGASVEVALGERLELSSPPLIYGTATYTVKSGSESHCEVDEATGVITGLDQGFCTIEVAFAGNENYEPLTATDLQTVRVVDGNQQLTFSDPYGEEPALAVGGTLAIVNAPVATAGSDPGGVINYREAPGSTGICSVNAGDGTVTGEAVGECLVQAQGLAVKDYDRTAWMDLVTLSLSEGTLDIAWTPENEGILGTDLVLTAAVDNAGGANISYSVADAGDTDCAFQGNSGAAERTLTFDAPGLCKVVASATKEHYQDRELERAIRVRPGVITAGTIPDFVSNRTLPVGGSNRRPDGNYSLNPSDAVSSWQLVRGERDCELVDATNGLVRALAQGYARSENPVCSIQVVARRENYALFKSEPREIPWRRVRWVP